MPQHVDNGHDQTAEADRTKAVGQSASSSTPGSSLGHVVGAEIPAAVDARNDDMDSILEPFGDPVAGESDKDEEAYDFCRGTSTRALTTRRIVARIEFDVHRDKRDGKPRTKGCGKNTTDEGDKPHVTEALRDVDTRGEHQSAEGNARDPCDEADDRKDGEEQEDDSARVVLAREHVDCGDEPEENVEDAGGPYEGLGECYMRSIFDSIGTRSIRARGDELLASMT